MSWLVRGRSSGARHLAIAAGIICLAEPSARCPHSCLATPPVGRSTITPAVYLAIAVGVVLLIVAAVTGRSRSSRLLFPSRPAPRQRPPEAPG
jgi:hypothetical protein